MNPEKFLPPSENFELLWRDFLFLRLTKDDLSLLGLKMGLAKAWDLDKLSMCWLGCGQGL